MSDPNSQPDGAGYPYPGQQPYDAPPTYPSPQYQGYGQGPADYGYIRPPAKNNMAVAALILGIIGLVTSLFVIGGLLGVVGLILGIISLRASKLTGTGTGRGMAIGGIITSAVAILATTALVIVAAWFAHRVSDCNDYSRDNPQYNQCIQQHFHLSN